MTQALEANDQRYHEAVEAVADYLEAQPGGWSKSLDANARAGQAFNRLVSGRGITSITKRRALLECVRVSAETRLVERRRAA